MSICVFVVQQLCVSYQWLTHCDSSSLIDVDIKQETTVIVSYIVLELNFSTNAEAWMVAFQCKGGLTSSCWWRLFFFFFFIVLPWMCSSVVHAKFGCLAILFSSLRYVLQEQFPYVARDPKAARLAGCRCIQMQSWFPERHSPASRYGTVMWYDAWLVTVSAEACVHLITLRL